MPKSNNYNDHDYNHRCGQRLSRSLRLRPRLWLWLCLCLWLWLYAVASSTQQLGQMTKQFTVLYRFQSLAPIYNSNNSARPSHRLVCLWPWPWPQTARNFNEISGQLCSAAATATATASASELSWAELSDASVPACNCTRRGPKPIQPQTQTETQTQKQTQLLPISIFVQNSSLYSLFFFSNFYYFLCVNCAAEYPSLKIYEQICNAACKIIKYFIYKFKF